MAIFIVENNGKISYGIKKYVCKTMADIPVEVNGEEIAPGSKVYVSDEKKTYMLNTAGQWVEIKEGGGASALSDLADVDISGTIQGGKVLKYNAVEEKWVPGDDSGNVQSDWNENDPTSGAFILNKPTIPAAQVQSDWNESDTTSKAYIQNKPTIPAAITELDDIPDVDITEPEDGQVLSYDATSDKWVAGAPGSSGIELTQAEYDALTPEEKTNGTEYFITDGTNAPIEAASILYDNEDSGLFASDVQNAIDELNYNMSNLSSDLEDLEDVNISNVQDGQIIKYDATNQIWVNADDEGGTELPVPTTADIGKSLVVESDGQGGTQYAYDINSCVELTQTEYDALTSEEKNNGAIYQISDKGYFYYKEKKFHQVKELTMAEYNQLTPAEQNNGVEYFITDAPEIVTEITLADYEELTLEEQMNGTIYQIIDCGYFFYKGNRFMASLELTLAEYNNLTLEEQMNGTEYFITDAPEMVTDLAQVEYDALTTEQKNNGSIYQISDKGYCYYKEKQFRATKELTQAQYNALTPEQKADGTIYMISDATNNLSDLDDVTLTSPADGDALIYNSNTSKWVNSPIPHFDIDMNDVEDGQTIQYSSKVNAFISAEVQNTINELYNESTGTLINPKDLDYYLSLKAQHPVFSLGVSNGSNMRSVPIAICAHYLSINGSTEDVTALMDSYTKDSSVIADPTIKFYIDCYFMRDPSTMKKLVLSLSVSNPTMTVESYTTVTDIFS